MSQYPKQSKDLMSMLPEAVRKQTVPEKIRTALAATRWDALVVLGVENAQYCSGAWIPMGRGYLDRQNIIIWPRDGEPIYITGAEWINALKPSSFITRFVGYEEQGALPPAVIVDTVADVLREEGLANGLIGLEMLRTSVLFWNRLCEFLPNASFESADEMLRRMRMVKVGEEIEKILTGASLTDDGVWNAYQSTKAGESEFNVAHRVMLNVLGNGCQAFPSILLGTGEGARALGAPTERRLQAGDIVRVDLNSMYEGYYCDMGRMAVVGDPNAAQIRAYRDHLELKRRILDFMQPGRTCAECHAFYLEQAEQLNLKLFIYPYIGYGHGTGVNNDEYPKLNGADQTVLEPGMILNIEPDTEGPLGEVMHNEDMIMVTSDGVEVITESKGHDWSELLVIPA